jgi:hypothetical protein
MAKVMGNLRITTNPASEGLSSHFEVVFVPYAGRLNTVPVKVAQLDELVSLLINLKISEDEATRWAGKTRTQGVVLIPSVERTEILLKEYGLLA